MICGKAEEDITFNDLTALHCFAEGISEENKRSLRLLDSQVPQDFKKGGYGTFVSITTLPKSHIRSCWCQFLKRIWIKLQGIDRYGYVTIDVTLPTHVIDILKVQSMDKMTYLFQCAVKQFSVALAKHCFNGKTLYVCSERGLHIPIPLWGGKLTFIYIKHEQN
jgi:hypothetical protein